jgi:ankyrin repeat protein
VTDVPDPVAAFIKASVWHGPLDDARAILAAHPDIATRSIHAAAILGDEATVRRFLERDSRNATTKGGPYQWDALTHLCFSRYLQLDGTRSDRFVRTATALLDAGASAATGYYDTDHEPEPQFESALYGAAGVAHHADLTHLLLEHGADPNDAEVPYHSPETFDNAVIEILVKSGRMTPDSLATMLLRKHDWHDYDGIKCLLHHGADPNRRTQWRRTALQQGVLRDNAIQIIELALDHGADPLLVVDGPSAAAVAARRGRGDVLELLERRNVRVEFDGVERLIAACARNNSAVVRALADREPQLVRELVADGGTVLAEFAGNGNEEGVRHLLELGVDVGARFTEGDGYWGLAKDSTALHVAAWRARHGTVKLLIERGAAVDARDSKGRTPLALAVRACVDSYWTHLRSPESVEALLNAGATANGVTFPSGYAEVDELLRRRGAGG